MLAWNGALGHRTFFDREQRLACFALEYEEEPVLCRLCDRVDGFTVLFDSDQLRGSDKIVVPKIMMHGLVMPDTLPRTRIQRQQAVRKKIRSDAIRSIVVVGRLTGGHKDDTALRIYR